MPARSARQQRLAGADLARCRAGTAPVAFPCKVAAEFAVKPKGGYPVAAKLSARKKAT